MIPLAWCAASVAFALWLRRHDHARRPPPDLVVTISIDTSAWDAATARVISDVASGWPGQVSDFERAVQQVQNAMNATPADCAALLAQVMQAEP